MDSYQRPQAASDSLTLAPKTEEDRGGDHGEKCQPKSHALSEGLEAHPALCVDREWWQQMQGRDKSPPEIDFIIELRDTGVLLGLTL